MIKLSYCTFGLTQLDFLSAISEVDKTGYPGVELSFHRDQFNPFEIDDDSLEAVANHLKTLQVKPACVATASHFFTPSQPHEPSLMCIDLAGRKRRIDLVKRGIHTARKLGVPLVTFGSGFLRDEHVRNPQVNPRELLIESIHECLGEIREDEDISLLIEPEPGMYIEKMEDGIRLVNEIDSKKFRLHVDICHAYCSEKDYVAALGEAAPYTRYLHVSDAQDGYNLKFVKYVADMQIDLGFASHLVYFPETADFLLVDKSHPVYFCDAKPGRTQMQLIESILQKVEVEVTPAMVDYPGLFAGATPFDDEVFTYLISVPELSYDVLERARPVLLYLRDGQRPMVDKMIANTLTGVVHFHEIPGEGSLDFAASFKALNEHGFNGYGSVELYHHVASWEKALRDSYKHLSKFV